MIEVAAKKRHSVHHVTYPCLQARNSVWAAKPDWLQQKGGDSNHWWVRAMLQRLSADVKAKEISGV